MDGLIIKTKWIDLILSGKKVIELRGCDCKSHINTYIALIESSSGMIKGHTFLYRSINLCKSGLEQLFLSHCVNADDLSLIKYKKIFGWYIINTQRYDIPIPYKHPKGAVIWVKNVL